MMSIDAHSSGFARQQGAALFVSMIIIFMLSIMGVSAMRGSTLEHRMASNSAYAIDVLQAAESSNELALNNYENLKNASNSGPITIETNLRVDINMRSEVTLKYVGEGNAVGFSLNADQDAPAVSSHRYIAEGSAILESVQASRRIEQGAYRIAPSINTRIEN